MKNMSPVSIVICIILSSAILLSLCIFLVVSLSDFTVTRNRDSPVWIEDVRKDKALSRVSELMGVNVRAGDLLVDSGTGRIIIKDTSGKYPASSLYEIGESRSGDTDKVGIYLSNPADK